MAILQALVADGNVLSRIGRRPRTFGKPGDITWPQQQLLTLHVSLDVGLKVFVFYNGNPLRKLRILHGFLDSQFLTVLGQTQFITELLQQQYLLLVCLRNQTPQLIVPLPEIPGNDRCNHPSNLTLN